MKMMNLFLLFVCVFTCNAQNIEGSWQLNSPLLANYQAGYEFYENNNFAYTPDRYNGLSRNLGISGKYEIKQDSIYFTVLYISERIGGTIRRRPTITNKRSEMELYWISSEKSDYRPIPSTSNYWELTNCKVQRITLEKPETWSASFKYYKDKSGQEIIEIDGDKFYYIPGPDEFGTEE
jgi:hypothetical protein